MARRESLEATDSELSGSALPPAVLGWFRGLDTHGREKALRALVRQCDLEVLSSLHDLLGRLLQRDFISALPEEIVLRILSHMDARSLCAIEVTCRSWQHFLQAHGAFLWGELCRQRGWDPKYHAFRPSQEKYLEKAFYRYKYLVEQNWERGEYVKRTFTGHTKAVFCVQLEDTVLFSGSFDHTVRIWDVVSGECSLVLEGHKGGVSCLRYEQGLLVSGSSDTTLRVWDVETGRCVAVLEGHTAEVTGLYHDGTTLMSSSCDHTLRVWDLNKRQCLNTLVGHTDYVISVQFDSTTVATASLDRTVRLWDRESGECRLVLAGHTQGVRCVRFDRVQVVSGSEDATVRIWDRQTGLCSHLLRGHEQEVWSVQMLHTGYGSNNWLRRIVSGGRDGVRVWEAPTFECHVIINSGGPRLGTICIDLDPCTIVSSSFDKTISLFNFDVVMAHGDQAGQSNRGRRDDRSPDPSRVARN